MIFANRKKCIVLDLIVKLSVFSFNLWKMSLNEFTYVNVIVFSTDVVLEMTAAPVISSVFVKLTHKANFGSFSCGCHLGSGQLHRLNKSKYITFKKAEQHLFSSDSSYILLTDTYTDKNLTVPYSSWSLTPSAKTIRVNFSLMSWNPCRQSRVLCDEEEETIGRGWRANFCPL